MESLEDRLALTGGLAGAGAGAIHAAMIQSLGNGAATTSVAESTNQATFGQAVTLTSTVTPVTPGAAAATGNISFFDGPALLGVAPIVNGVATLNTWDVFLVGSNSIQANYWGDANYAVSDSTPIDLEVSMAPTVTTLSTSGTSGLSATVGRATPGGGTPTGVVAFFDGGKLVGSVLVSNGMATLNPPSGVSAGHAYTASYYGDSDFSPSTSAPASQNTQNIQSLSADGSHTALSLRAIRTSRGAVVGLGLDATVSDSKPGAAVPTGTVTFYVDGRAARTVALTNGKASLVVPLKNPHGHTFSAHYNGMTGVKGSQSPVIG